MAPPAIPEGCELALQVWELMGRRLDWLALEPVLALVGALQGEVDLEQLLYQLLTLRDKQLQQ